MRSILRILMIALATAFMGAACSSSKPEDPVPAQPPAAPKTESEPVPRFLQNIKTGQPLPQVLSADLFRDTPALAAVYRTAARIPVVLAQQPCYCHCDRMGHSSLLDCFATDHGAACDICIKEVLVADRMTRAGANPVQVREAIIRGDWKAEALPQ